MALTKQDVEELVPLAEHIAGWKRGEYQITNEASFMLGQWMTDHIGDVLALVANPPRYTVHEITRDGTPHQRVLLSSPFVDIVVPAALGTARDRWRDGVFMEIREPGFRVLVICEDGKPWKYVECLEVTRNEWSIKEA